MPRFSPTPKQLRRILLEEMDKFTSTASIYNGGCTSTQQRELVYETISYYTRYREHAELLSRIWTPHLWHSIKYQIIEVPINIRIHRTISVPIEIIDEKTGTTKYTFPYGGPRTRDFVTATVEEIDLYFKYRLQHANQYNEWNGIYRDINSSATRRSNGNRSMTITEIINKTGGL